MIQLHRLEGFYRVAVAEGYSRAAKSFPYPITQPGVHQQVKKLEDDLGTRLFRRVAKDRVGLTQAGRHLFEFCAPFFERLPLVVDELRAGALGTLRVDAGPQEIRHVIPAFLLRLRRRAPELRVEIREVSAVSAESLRSGRTDLVLEYWPDAPKDLAQAIVGRVHALWIAPSEFSSRKRVSLPALASVPFITFAPGSSEHGLQLRALAHAGLRPQSLLHASSTDAILGFVQAGLGYSLIPWPDRTGPNLARVVTSPLRAPGSVFQIHATWLREAKGPTLEAAIAALRSAP
jgi:DNA-binding transcriptional LysR family regulator